MNSESSTISPQQVLAHGFARRLVRWLTEMSPDSGCGGVLERAAYLASLVTAQGDVYADVSDWSMAERQTLLDSGLVAKPTDIKVLPLVLDGDGRLYLYRYFDYERRLATYLSRMAGSLDSPSDAARECLSGLFNDSGNEGETDWQKVAAGMALLSRLTIISGGPGTGKTTTVVKLLACLLTDHPDARIAMAAPTGKAAARMVEALQGQVARLTSTGLLSVDMAMCLPATASTLHRLLGTLPGGGFRHHAGNPLPLDVLIVDEASMLDLAMATRLVEAMPAEARLILLGDKDQLAAVEAGSVFAEIASDPSLSAERVAQLSGLTGTPAAAIRPEEPIHVTPLDNAVVWFTRNYRFHEAPGIGRLAGLINSGQDQAVLASLNAGDSSNIEWIADSSRESLAGLGERLLGGYADYLAAIPVGVPDMEQLRLVFAAFNRFRVLCAIRSSPAGVDAANRQLSELFRQRLRHPLDVNPRSEWFPGRPVMVLRNDYTSRLFNGDIGLVLPHDQGEGLGVCFPGGDTGYRFIPLAWLPEYDTAFAMTVHKSQGSEFERMALILPDVKSRVVTRELLYTAVTRARQHVLVVGGAEILTEGIRTLSQRRSGLLSRLLEEQNAQAALS